MFNNSRAGQQLGNYRLVHLLGKGGFADVYLGNHVLLNTQAAIKVLNAHLTQTDVQHFFAEARTNASLSHPNIIRVLEFGVEPVSKIPYLVMDYAPGGSLRQKHPRGTKLDFSMIIAYTKQIASALQYVHDHHLIHCDVKPENMLLGRNNEVLLGDFGIARATQNLNKMVFGTADYMAPEQQGTGSSPESDQYALGVVVYEWLCGSVPFTGLSSQEIAYKHANELPPSLCTKDPAISPSLEAIVFRALEKDPGRRYSSVKIFADEIERVLQQGQNVSAPPTLILALPVDPSATPTLPLMPVQSSPGIAAPTLRQPVSPPGSTVPMPIPPTLPQHITVPATVRFWQPAKRMPGDTLFVYAGHNNLFVNSVAWSPDSTRIASGGDDQIVHLWEAFTGREILEFCEHRDQIEAVAWSPDGSCIVSGCARQIAHVWQADTGTLLTTYMAHVGHGEDVSIVSSFAVAWSPDGSVIASGSSDKTIHLWDFQKGTNRGIYQGHTAEINAVTWSPDGQYIASASDDKHVRVWNRATQQTFACYDAHTKRVRAIVWSPDRTRFASAGDDTKVIVWSGIDPGNSHILLVYTGHARKVRALAWSPDSTRLASASDDRTIRIWNAATGELVLVYRGHTGEINALAWSSDGTYIASASNDATVHVWQAE